MFVRLTESYERRGVTWPAGAPLELPADEAAELIEDGRAIPLPVEKYARETR